LVALAPFALFFTGAIFLLLVSSLFFESFLFFQVLLLRCAPVKN